MIGPTDIFHHRTAALRCGRFVCQCLAVGLFIAVPVQAQSTGTGGSGGAGAPEAAGEAATPDRPGRPGGAPVASEPPIAKQSLDLAAMLGQTPLLTGRISDPVWSLQAREGRVMLQLPIAVSRRGQSAQLEDPAIAPGVGRFVGWRLPEQLSSNRARRRRSRPAQQPRPPRRHAAGNTGDAAASGNPGNTNNRDAARGAGNLPQRARPRVPRLNNRGVPQRGNEPRSPQPGGGPSENQPQTSSPPRQSPPAQPQRDRGAQADRPGRGLSDQPETAGAGLPEGAPRVFREAKVAPEGRLQWELERAVPGVDVKEGEQLYMLRLRPDRLRERRPERGGATQRRRQTRDRNRHRRRRRSREQILEQRRRRIEQRQRARERRAREEQQYRKDIRQYRQLREQVQQLDQQFTVPLPARLWAMFEIRRGARSIEIEGPAPLPWTVPLAALVQARQMAGQRSDDYQPANQSGADRGGGRFQRRGRARRTGDAGPAGQSASAMVQWAKDGHPLTHQLLADALARGEALGELQQGGSRVTLVRVLLQSSNAAARRQTATALLAAEPRGGEGRGGPLAGLLREAVTRVQGPMQAKLLARLFEVQGQRGPRQTVATANRMLQDQSGLSPRAIVTALVEQIEGEGGGGDEQAIQAAAEAIDLTRLTGERARQAIAGVIETAPRSTLARQWLSGQLLTPGSNLIDPTLNMLAAARIQRPTQRPGPGDRSRSPARAARAGEAGGKANQRGGSAAPTAPRHRQAGQTNTHSNETDQSGEAGGPSGVTLAGPIPLTRQDHPLLSLLQSDNAQRRSPAWRALPRFAVIRPEGGRSAGRWPNPSQAGPRPGELLTTIVEAGLAQQPTPEALVTFLTGQGHTEAGAKALLQLARQSDGAAGKAAAQAVLGWGRSIVQPITDLPAKQLRGLARRLYAAKGDGEPPGVIALLGGPAQGEGSGNSGGGGPADQWFAQQVARGRLPKPAAWIEPLGGAEALLQRVRQQPDQATRQAVAAALVESAGGDASDARSLAQQFNNAGDGSGGNGGQGGGQANQAQGQPGQQNARGQAPQQSKPSMEALKQAWTETKQQVYTRRLQSAAGRYRLVLAPAGVNGSADGGRGRAQPRRGAPRNQNPRQTRGRGGTGAAQPLPRKPLTLGRVQLIADGRSVRLATRTLALSVASEQLAIRIDDPTELKNFNHDALTDLDLPGGEPITLAPAADGAWQGPLRIQGRPWRVRLEPIE